jgi:hypothetical protein
MGFLVTEFIAHPGPRKGDGSPVADVMIFLMMMTINAVNATGLLIATIAPWFQRPGTARNRSCQFSYACLLAYSLICTAIVWQYAF